jgi:C4-dicarboxylate-specific signal transduction histidine kinase
MRRHASSGLLRYGYAVLAVIIALGVARALQAFDLEGFVFVIAVAMAVWFGGLGPGLLAIALSILVLHYFLVAPFDTGSKLQNTAYFVVFAALAVLITALSETRHRAEQSLLQNRDDLEASVRKRTAELQQAQAVLAHVSRVTTLGEMAASIAHEVDQPLSGVVINANASLRFLTAASPNLDEVRDGLQAIARDGRRASEVIGRIRALARRTAIEREFLDIDEVIRDVVALTEGEARRTRASVRTELAANLPRVVGDRVQLQQVVLNLLLNGMEAMHAVVGRPRELVITTCREANDRVRVAVQDSGTGIDPQLGDRIFDAFCTTKPDGMGMGLCISRSIIEQHGGRLWVVPNESPGTTFTFTV